MDMNFIGIHLGITFIKGAVLGLEDLSIRHVERPKPQWLQIWRDLSWRPCVVAPQPPT